MSQKSVLALACLSALVVGGFVIAEDGVAVFQRSDGTIEFEPVTGQPASIALAPSGTVPNTQTVLASPHEVIGNTNSEAGPYQVIAVGDGAILLNVNSGETWRTTKGDVQSWVSMSKFTEEAFQESQNTETPAKVIPAH